MSTDTTDVRAELEAVSPAPGRRTLVDLIDRNTPELEKLLGTATTVERFKTLVLTELRRTPALYECDPVSVVGAMRLVAQLGLEVGPLGHAYIVPFRQRGATVATFILGYKGIVQLAYRGGMVKRIETGLVCKGDAFTFRRGTTASLLHTPAGPMGDREWTHVWAVAETRHGGKLFEVLFPEDVERRRKRSPAAQANSGPWVTDTAAMWRKSAVRALAPMLPQSPALARGLEYDDAAVPADELDAEPINGEA